MGKSQAVNNDTANSAATSGASRRLCFLANVPIDVPKYFTRCISRSTPRGRTRRTIGSFAFQIEYRCRARRNCADFNPKSEVATPLLRLQLTNGCQS